MPPSGSTALDRPYLLLSTQLLQTGTEFARKLWGGKLCIICISYKYNFIVCVSMTSPCSLNRSTTFLQIMEIIYFEDHGPSAPWVHLWRYWQLHSTYASTWQWLLGMCFFNFSIRTWRVLCQSRKQTQHFNYYLKNKQFIKSTLFLSQTSAGPKDITSPLVQSWGNIFPVSPETRSLVTIALVSHQLKWQTETK